MPVFSGYVQLSYFPIYVTQSHILNSSFQAGICFLCIIYTYFRVPEPQGRTFAELDLLFERGVSARKFATTYVDVFDEDIRADVVDKYEEQILDRPHGDVEKVTCRGLGGLRIPWGIS
jgi:hypothetical protein